MPDFKRLTDVANERFAQYLAELPGPTEPHRVEFSKRITTSWALIYYRRHLVRLSPYLFLLQPHELKHETHWQELDATLRHEAAHAAHFAMTREPGHTNGFHALLSRLGVEANGACDLGPENFAYRYVYGCPECGVLWHRRQSLRVNFSCGDCAPGRYEPEVKMSLVVDLGSPAKRLRLSARAVEDALEEAMTSTSAPQPRPRRIDGPADSVAA